MSFAEFSDPTQRMFATFATHIGAVERAARRSPAVPGELAAKWTRGGKRDLIVWRLMASPRRELGRCPRGYDTFVSAQRAAQAVVAGAERLDSHIVTSKTAEVSGWFLSLFDVPLLVCGHWQPNEELAIAEMNEARAALDRALVSNVVKPLPVARSGPLGLIDQAETALLPVSIPVADLPDATATTSVLRRRPQGKGA
ncbi:hypothetical protein [Compostimonas suwonensis]|uniref:hypothetical protein n=1 Tax=Compostimonas suwonensis TaxID=1048394 RepID=UPI0012FD6286|nr:hypothetical protein [Compostimonas suwonensis]